MKGEVSNTEAQEVKPPLQESYRDIKPKKDMSMQGTDEFWKNEFQNFAESPKNIHCEAKGNEVRDYYTAEEKMKYAAQFSSGEWKGEPGNSEFIPDNLEARRNLEKYGQTCIEYKEGNPDFSKVSEATVEIDDMTSNRYLNFRQADVNTAELWSKQGKNNKSDWTPRDVKQWRTEHKYTFHEQADMKTMDLVPRELHAQCKHVGGVAECFRKEDQESEFDE